MTLAGARSDANYELLEKKSCGQSGVGVEPCAAITVWPLRNGDLMIVRLPGVCRWLVNKDVVFRPPPGMPNKVASVLEL
jgi:hypothetical protein